MNLGIVSLALIFFFSSGLEVKADRVSSVTVKNPLVSINGIQKKLTQSTSCDAKDWDNNELTSCTCCILKKAFEGGDVPVKETLAHCLNTTKQCTIYNQFSLGYGQAKSDEEFIQNLIDKSRLFSPIDLPPGAFLKDKESLSPVGVILLLAKLFDNEADLSERLDLEPKDLGKCYEAKVLGEGGAKTLQLFAIKNRCEKGSPIKYILKEMLVAEEEAANIDKIKNSDLNIMNLNNPGRPRGLPGIALDIVNIVYQDKKNNHHRMALLTLAPGQSFFDLTRDFVMLHKQYLEGAVTKSDYISAQMQLKRAFLNLGLALGAMHLKFKPKGAEPLTKTNALHGDLHLHNVFVDPSNSFAITLIDTETMALSIDRARNITDDLHKVYVYATLHRFSKQRARKGLPAEEWHRVMFKPFIQGYANAYKDVPLQTIKKALLDIYGPKLFTNIMNLVRANPLQIREYQRNYLHPMIKGIRPPPTSRPLPPPPRPKSSTPPRPKSSTPLLPGSKRVLPNQPSPIKPQQKRVRSLPENPRTTGVGPKPKNFQDTLKFYEKMQ